MKLNLGCSTRRLPGYWNIDIDPAVHLAGYSDECGSACCLCQYTDNSVDEIYASHLLDHLSRNEQLDNTLSEWYRVLKPGGILRVAVSDFEKTVKMYNEGVDLERLWGTIVGGQKTDYDCHKCTFDFTVLRRYLEKHGFVYVKRYCWQDFLPKGFTDNSCAAIPKYDLDGYLMSLNVECLKNCFPKKKNDEH